ncbi:melanization protease 1 isoform X2 [Cephus cinctus]|uniref:CLIP domain-containing serine protease n=1 Tax=Cephus cinctus TaxID=211228 RepID=A0AAJ7BQ61_CEPCN|nr:melanization protease 1 isoform X2 [Cephus cinctus]
MRPRVSVNFRRTHDLSRILMTILYLTFILLVTGQIVNGQGSCTTPKYKPGTCINIKECEALINILKQARPLPQDSLDLLRRSQCGFEGKDPKVCCETEISTPVTTEQTVEERPTVIPDPPDVTKHPNLRLLNNDICGPVTQQKIFGGNKTGVFDFPWMALIAYNTGAKNPEFRCGGSIINKRYVLTAAHCVTLLPAGLTLIGVRLGEHDLSTERDCDKDENGLEVVCAERYQDFRIESVHHHPDYSRTKLHNDIALIRLSGDADFRPESVRPICLPIGTASRITHKKVTVTGWGATEYGPRSQDLLMVQLALVDNNECAEIYKKSTKIWYKQMCAGGTNQMDSCHGDSGGPLQSPGIYYGQIRNIQYGVVSFGLRNCGTGGFPGVYTTISYYLDWILDIIKE